MASLATASPTATERRVLERFVGLLREEFGAGLRGVWLYGSRARGEQPGAESDVDVLVVATPSDADEHHRRVFDLLSDASMAEGANPLVFSIQVYEPDRVADRRRIRSFFFQEVDRDKIVLFGEP